MSSPVTRQSEQAARDRAVAKRLESLNAHEVIRAVESIICERLTPAGRQALDACRQRGRVLAGSKNGTALKALQSRGVLVADMFGVYRFSENVVRHLERALEQPRLLPEFLWMVTADHRDGGRHRQWVVIAGSAAQAFARLKAALGDVLAYEDFEGWRAHPAQCSVAFEVSGDVGEHDASCSTAPPR